MSPPDVANAVTSLSKESSLIKSISLSLITLFQTVSYIVIFFSNVLWANSNSNCFSDGLLHPNSKRDTNNIAHPLNNFK